MRYPDTLFMKRTFDLARNRLGLADRMLPYIPANDNTFLHFNGIRMPLGRVDDKFDVFKVSESNGGVVPDEYVAEGFEAFRYKILGELRQLFVNYPFDAAFEKLMEFDGHTVTSYLTFVKKLPYSVIKWYETMDSRTGLFDASLIETVLMSLTSMDPHLEGKDVDWFCFE